MNRPVSGFKFLALTFALLSLFALITGTAFGQAISGGLNGSVTDPSGAAVVGATVVATHTATGQKVTARTGSLGDYRFNELPVGTYKITITAPNFKTATIGNV